MITLLLIILGLALIGSVIFLVIGLVAPNTALFWYKGKRTRALSFLTYLGCMTGSLILIGVCAPNYQPSTAQTPGSINHADSSLAKTQEEAKPSPPTIASTQEPHIINSVEEFRNRFNTYNEKNNFDFHVGDIDIKRGEVRDAFTYQLNDYIALGGSLNKSDNSVRELYIICMGGDSDGKVATGANIISVMAGLIASVDPQTTPTNNRTILKHLKVIDGPKSISGLSTKTVQNGVKYWLNCSEGMGIWFGASVPD